jgi:tripartite-type tricarboxylate transporter receptor subunit TctC
MMTGWKIFWWAAALIAAAPAAAQSYPDKPIKVIVPVAPGGGSDLLARQMASKLAGILPQPIVVENRPGGGGVVGIASVARATPDGYTLLHVGSAMVMGASFRSDLPYDPVKDFEPIAMLAQIPLVLVVHPSFPSKTLKELIAEAKAKPGQLNYASFNPGGPSHLAGELLKHRAAIDMVHIAYKGSAPALQDVLAGRVPIMFDAISTSLPHIKAGSLRPLAVTTLVRSPVLPDVPTVAEAGLPDYYVAAWVAVFAPRGTPPAALDRLNTEFNKVLGDTEVRSALEKQGWVVVPGDRAALGKFVEAELTKWRQLVVALKIKPD